MNDSKGGTDLAQWRRHLHSRPVVVLPFLIEHALWFGAFILILPPPKSEVAEPDPTVWPIIAIAGLAFAASLTCAVLRRRESIAGSAVKLILFLLFVAVFYSWFDSVALPWN